MSSYEIRVPEALMLASLPPWVKMVWISARSFQGAGTHCYASLDMIGNRAVLATGKPMDRGQVSHAIRALVSGGFIERSGNKRLRCTSPEVEHHSTFDREEQPPKVEHHSTKVEQGSTPSKNQQGKPTRKTNKRFDTVFPDDAWQMVFASTAFDRLLSFDLLPASMRQKRPHTLQAFATEFDKLNRIDGHEQDAIAEVMRWLLTADNWWIGTANFRSVLKLRKPHKDGGTYFDQFLSQAKTNRHARPTATSPRPDTRQSGGDPVRTVAGQPGRYDYLIPGPGGRRTKGLDGDNEPGGDSTAVSAGAPVAQLRRVV